MSHRKMVVKPAALALLCLAPVLLTPGCTAKPDAAVAEEAVKTYFKEKGYSVRELTLGRIFRNPVAERVYMAPLTYVVEIPSITLEAGAGGTTDADLVFSGASVKIHALSPPRQGWAVAQVTGIALPLPER